MKTKLKIIIPAIVAVIAIVTAILCIKFSSSESTDIKSMLSTAEKYLLEQNYEQAIAEFEKIIEIDPKNADAYLGLAEAYEKSGNIPKAIEVLEEGLKQTGDERIKSELERLKGLTESETVAEETTVETTTEETTTTTEETTTTTVTTTETTTTVTTTEKKEEYITIKGEKYSTDYLIRLELSQMGLTDDDIKDLDKMVNLESLLLRYNQISDISPLSKLTNLEGLSLQDNQISDISPLSSLKNLKYLYLDDNQISDISVLSKLTNLETLSLNYNQISDISPLSSLTNLTRLDLSGNQVSDSDAQDLKEALRDCTVTI